MSDLTATFLGPNNRSNYYLDAAPPRRPKSFDPAKHTMKRVAFRKYIGRDRAKPGNYSIDCKKFSEAQKAHLVKAYTEGLVVRVLGAPRLDSELVAQSRNCEIDVRTIEKFYRSKLFNKHRQMTCFAKNAEKTLELWIFVFPSANYVDQIAELILAIFEDFSRCRLPPKVSPDIFIHHFPSLEKEVSLWTEFEPAVSHLVRYGDVVAIGNVDLIVEGIGDLGFEPRSEDWEYVGLEGMFALKVFVDPASSRRLVLLGVTECFWGQASAHYVDSLLNCGARHILYGSKAATLIDWDEIGRVLSPQTFYTFDVHENGENEPISTEGQHDSGISTSIFMPFRVKASGGSMTVPTVIGEDDDQRARYGALNPSCMDCENGYIARVIRLHNEKLVDRLGSSFGKDAHFIPVHFITDYIYRQREKANKRNRTLAVHDEPGFLIERNESFRRIGNCFGTYALKFGLRDDLIAPSKVRFVKYSSVDVERSFGAIRSLLEAGAGHRAILNLLSQYDGGEVPLSDLIVICAASQKCGFIQLFDASYRLLTEETAFSRLSSDDRLQVEMLRLKVFSQLGNFVAAKAQFVRVTSLTHGTSLLEVIGQQGAYYRRLALFHVAAGDLREAERAFRTAEQYAIDQKSAYQIQTNKLFRLIGALFQNDALEDGALEDKARELSEIRSHFGDLISKGTLWTQTHLEKCAIAALYLDSAYHLKLGGSKDVDRGLKALYLAQLQNVRFGGNERSETYGEILWATNLRWIESVIALSMRRDTNFLQRFEAFIRSETLWMIDLSQRGSALLNIPPAEREMVVFDLLNAR